MNTKKLSELTFSDLTKYPKVFESSYWGSFRIDKNKNNEIDDIITNRDDFVEKYKIIKYVEHNKPIHGSGIFDHCELYKCEEGFVYVTSPYQEYNELSERLEFSLYKKLYLQNANSYIRLFVSKQEFDKFLKSL